MNHQHIANLLDKYWESETTLLEEQELTKFFQQENIPAEFQAFQSLFLAKAEATESDLSSDFDVNILTMIAEENLKENLGKLEAKIVQMQPNTQQSEIRRLRWIAGIAASIALILAFYITMPKPQTEIEVAAKELTKEEHKEALKAYKQAREALFFVSDKMNQGTQKAAEGLRKAKNLDKVLEELE